MYAVTVLNTAALSAFRAEHPWLNFPDSVTEVSVYFDDNGGPTRLTAVKGDAQGATAPADVNSFGVETILALVRYAPQGIPGYEDCPEEESVWNILENLSVSDGSLPIEEVEAARSSQLQQAYEILRDVTVGKLGAILASTEESRERSRLEASIASIPRSLDKVDDAHKAHFLEVDLWRLVAVLRDELALPADYEISDETEEPGFTRDLIEQAEATALSGPVIQALFELSPVAFSISSIGQRNSRYVRVNQAYLDLIGKSWDEIRGSEMVASGVVSGNEARAERLRLLDRDGGYSGQRGEIHGADGQVIEVTISARRISVAGQLYDFEVLTRVDQPSS
ncbi:PAS domain-containing protein [Rhizobium glycinendophyticum]|uniref:PAS domain-containing protein n=1 Tax=Rhizobium glycinendophyticum TaxID=2589807 RepID=A0A504UEY1_9HYPH|nr:PAS domain-containing protein [Rhizobium glycinendophyticum]TPP05421.1 PAS domain-containing protein [Rhizobium glycinendophyticum]